MKLLAYEMPFCKSDCIFAKQRWSEDEGMWINYCKFNDERCDLYIDIRGHSECKYTDDNPPIADGRSWCEKHNSYMYFCSDGERSKS